jgi:hypothetical protein
MEKALSGSLNSMDQTLCREIITVSQTELELEKCTESAGSLSCTQEPTQLVSIQ